MEFKRRWCLLVLLLCVGVVPEASAYLSPPVDYKGSVEQSAQEAIIFFDGEREELILKASYKSPKGDGPANLSWIIPVPSLPDHYSVESPRLFRELRRKMKPQRKRKSLRGMNERRLDVRQVEKIGEYLVQPIGVSGVEAGAALNAWLKENKVNEVSIEQIRYYLARQYTFLAIRIEPVKGLKDMGRDGELRPLRISFKTNSLVYPIKFLGHQGQFDLTLYTVTPDEIIVPGRLGSNRYHEEFGLRRRVIRPLKLSAGNAHGIPSLISLWSKIVSEKRMNFTGAWITRFDGPMMNRSSKPLSDWPRDITLFMAMKPWAPFGFLR